MHLQTIEDIKLKFITESKASNVILSGRAATSILIALKTIKKSCKVKKPEIILPCISCATPANVALMCGFIPRFADVDPTTGLVNYDSIEAKYNKNTVVVFIIHSYGNTVDLGEISKWCSNREIVLIEDNAQAQGAILPCGNKVGYYGDFSIYSFSTTKFLESGGGLLVVRNGIYSVDSLIVKEDLFKDYIPISESKKRTLSLAYRNVHHSLASLDRINACTDIDTFFTGFASNFNDLNIVDFNNDGSQLIQEFNHFENDKQNRLRKADIYFSELSNQPNIKIISNHQKSFCCWRFTLLVDNRDVVAISENMRNEGFHVSNLYWNLNFYFNSSDICPNSNLFSRRIMNLWVDKTVNEDYIYKCCESLLKHIK